MTAAPDRAWHTVEVTIGQRRRFGGLLAAYLLAAAAEGLLSPMVGALEAELRLDRGPLTIGLGVLAVAGGVGSVLGGYATRATRPASVLRLSLLATGLGCLGVGAASNRELLLGAVSLLGLGAGGVQPSAVVLGASEAPGGRRGRTIGLLGAAASVGFVIAAALGAGAADRWRLVFATVGAALLASAAAVSAPPQLAAPPSPVPTRRRLGVPMLAVVGGALRYGVVALIPSFVMQRWQLRVDEAAAVLLAGQLLSIPSKWVVSAATDRFGTAGMTRATAMGVAGSATLALFTSSVALGISALVGLTTLVSILFPLANLAALGRGRPRPARVGWVRGMQLLAGGATALGLARFGVDGLMYPAIGLACLLLLTTRPDHAHRP